AVLCFCLCVTLLFLDVFFFVFFFFQAEDGIRDATVTGVQTCALPISNSMSTKSGRGALGPRRFGGHASRRPPKRGACVQIGNSPCALKRSSAARSCLRVANRSPTGAGLTSVLMLGIQRSGGQARGGAGGTGATMTTALPVRPLAVPWTR